MKQVLLQVIAGLSLQQNPNKPKARNRRGEQCSSWLHIQHVGCFIITSFISAKLGFKGDQRKMRCLDFDTVLSGIGDQTMLLKKKSQGGIEKCLDQLCLSEFLLIRI